MVVGDGVGALGEVGVESVSQRAWKKSKTIEAMFGGAWQWPGRVEFPLSYLHGGVEDVV